MENINDMAYVTDQRVTSKASIEKLKNTETSISAYNPNKYNGSTANSILGDLEKRMAQSESTVKSEIKVEAPKVEARVFVDGKSIPVQKMEFSVLDVFKQEEREIRRYGRGR